MISSRETSSNEVASTSLAHPYQIAGKVPGFIPPLPKQGSQGYIEDLSSKQKFELEEILERQNKLLRNKKFVANLPDKGAKIINFRDKIIKEIALKNEIDAAATLLSRLNVAAEGKAAMNELEWTGKYSETKSVEKIVELDSDDEEDPLKILAQPTGSGHHKKKIIHLPAEESLIKPEDLQDMDISNDQKQTEHVKYIVNIVEKTKVDGEPKVKESFKPYKTTVSNVHDPAKELGRKRDEHWEVTAATPPPLLHGIVKAIDINESLSLQRKQAEALTEILEKHAAERLAEQFGLHRIGNVPRITSGYRTMHRESSSSSSSDAEVNDVDEEHEVHDEGDTDKAGTVVFPIHN